jgi:hypothetical protein
VRISSFEETGFSNHSKSHNKRPHDLKSSNKNKFYDLLFGTVEYLKKLNSQIIAMDDEAIAEGQHAIGAIETLSTKQQKVIKDIYERNPDGPLQPLCLS